MKILVDFDGTCVKHDFPYVGSDIGAAEVLRELVACGHRLILFTMRCNHEVAPKSTDPNITNVSGMFLDDAVKWFKDNDIELYGIGKDPEQDSWTTSNKAYGDIMIDDSAVGCPLVYNAKGERPYVDWKKVREIFVNYGILKEKV